MKRHQDPVPNRTWCLPSKETAARRKTRKQLLLLSLSLSLLLQLPVREWLLLLRNSFYSHNRC